MDTVTELEAPSKIYKHGIEPRDDGLMKQQTQYVEELNVESSDAGSPVPASERPAPRRKTFVQQLKVFNGTLTHESFWHIFYRPIILLAVPPILWATLVMSVTIGFPVAISSNFASASNMVYHFNQTQSGLCFISGLIFTFLGLFGGGTFSDWVADYFTKRNGGIREPEMRLPAVMLGLITTPAALVLYGVGINNHLREFQLTATAKRYLLTGSSHRLDRPHARPRPLVILRRPSHQRIPHLYCRLLQTDRG